MNFKPANLIHHVSVLYFAHIWTEFILFVYAYSNILHCTMKYSFVADRFTNWFNAIWPNTR